MDLLPTSSLYVSVPKVRCPECGRDVAMHELEARTVAQRSGFKTTYRCPFCRAEFDSPSDNFV